MVAGGDAALEPAERLAAAQGGQVLLDSPRRRLRLHRRDQ